MSLIYKELEGSAEDGSRILDVGVGDGEHLVAIDGEITGVDLHPSCSNESISYVRADGTRLPFASNTFDFVVSNQVLEHIPHRKKQAYVDELARVLKPDGECLISFPSRLYPIPPHLMPPCFTWLPRPVGLFVSKYFLSDRRYEFYRTSAFNLTPLTARRLFDRAFGDVRYRTLDLTKTHDVEQDQWQKFDRILGYILPLLSIPGVEFLFELLFGYASYSCRRPNIT